MSYQIFKETQSYRGSWVMYLILLTEVPTLILMLVLFFTSEDRQEAGIALAVVFIVIALSFALLLNISLETRIDHTGIHYRYFPFIQQWRSIPKNQISSVKVITFNPLFDYGGWGIKGNKSTKLYNILGDEGLLIDAGESKKILLGTSKRKELEVFLENWREGEHA
ncbi:hypothetical protein JYB62_19445 [Algoriphagus lutimaris]|uniref:hypothetical protein n=1 Tax=Algoriphagus lutimaris TaxID=613197 RepID=UPI00196B0B90|nr:hypothetical protein [Algoriphagus lutimaris]MBN3522187.1 hypothetical protein [Algoriphagus lutimaris]